MLKPIFATASASLKIDAWFKSCKNIIMIR